MAIKKYSKVKFTLRKELIIMLAAIVVLVVATILLNLPNEEEKFLSKWQEAGSTMTENTLYEEVSFDELREILNGKEQNTYTFVFFATPSNADSVTYFDQFVSVAQTYDVKKIYIVDSAFALEGDREEDSEFDAELAQYEQNFKAADGETTIDLSFVPNLWVFNGSVLEDSASDYAVNETINWSLVLTQMFANGKPAN